MMMFEKDDPIRWFVTYAIDDALSSSMMHRERTKERLKNDFGCNISECYYNPQYLKEVLSDIYGKSYSLVIRKIVERLAERDSDKSVFRFISLLNR